MNAELLGQALLSAACASLIVVVLEDLGTRCVSRRDRNRGTTRAGKPLDRASRRGFERLLRERLDEPCAARVRALVLVSLDGAFEIGTLAAIESRLAAGAFPTDLVVRIGPGEFALLLDAIDVQAKRRRLERLAHSVRMGEPGAEGRTATVANLGCVQLGGKVSAAAAMDVANAALEEARRAGGGCVEHVMPAPTRERTPDRRRRVATSVSARESLRPDALVRVRTRLECREGGARGAWVRIAGGDRMTDEPRRLALARGLRALGARVIVEIDAEAPLAIERLLSLPCDALLIDLGPDSVPARAERDVTSVVAALRTHGIVTIVRLSGSALPASRLARTGDHWLDGSDVAVPPGAERLWSASRGFTLAA